MNIQDSLKQNALSIVGSCATEQSDNLSDGFKQILLIAPDEPNFWARFKSSPEFLDKQPNPLDRWSVATLDKIASDYSAKVIYPFSGPPWQPFLAWALRSGSCFVSPAGLLIHKERGLFISFRAGLAIKESKAPSDITSDSPCNSCTDKPCLSACPVDAISQTGYDVPKCIEHIDSNSGVNDAADDAIKNNCLDGCLVRRACPIGAEFRALEQSRFHMTAFVTNNRANKTTP